MMKKLSAILLLALTVAVGVGHAQELPSQCRPNGCGPAGFLGWAVPNTPLGCNFKSACDNHDTCYGRCINGCSEISGTPACDGSCKERKDQKDKCDLAFKQEMIAANPGKLKCQRIANDYYTFVSSCGCSFFKGFIEVAGKISLEAQEEFLHSFSAVQAFNEYRRRHPDNARGAEIDKGFNTLKIFGICEDNKFRFKLEDGQPVFSIESRTPLAATPASSVNTKAGEAMELQRFVSGIDVTHMNLGGKRFELKDAASMLSSEQLKSLRQVERFR